MDLPDLLLREAGAKKKTWTDIRKERFNGFLQEVFTIYHYEKLLSIPAFHLIWFQLWAGHWPKTSQERILVNKLSRDID